MLTRNTLASLSLFALMTLACSGTVSEPEDPPGGEDASSAALGSPGASDNPAGWDLIQPCPKDAPDDQIEVEDLEVNGSVVTITARHRSGCGTHTYGLCYEDEWAESYPVQVGVKLMHDSEGETCDAYGRVELDFDLTPLEAAYTEAYRTDTGAISIGLPGHPFIYGFGPEAILEWSDVETAIDRHNFCETVEDCRGIHIYPCNTAYVNADADITDLTEMIDSYFLTRGGYGDIGCTDDCPCGVLACEAEKCTTAASDCMAPAGDGQQNICL